jgi:thiosulfate/3-mercaptopyruvate sulfurtransferase
MSRKWLCLLLPLVVSGPATSAPYPRASLLVEAADVTKPENSRFRILDARQRASYRDGHIPGAVWVDHEAWAKAFNAGQDAETWAKLIGGLGINADTPVIVYDVNRAKDAARIWWILRYWGVKDVRLLNGGWTAWRAADGAVARGETAVAARSVKLTPEAARLSSKGQLLESLREGSGQVIDARSTQEFCGEAVTAKRNGSIPGAKHFEWSDVIDAKTQKFKSAEELTKLFREAGIDPDRPAVTYCQSGGRASVMAFALELMGAKGVRNYYKSWAEWGNADDTPIAKPTPKK